MVISETCSWVFHPYDGGADIVLKDEGEMKKLKNEFSNWLSSHPLGM